MPKAAGTEAVLAVLTMLYRRSPRITFSLSSALLFKAGLLVFLERA